jgi:hypothetical protein
MGITTQAVEFQEQAAATAASNKARESRRTKIEF